jgi:hypothetical protein
MLINKENFRNLIRRIWEGYVHFRTRIRKILSTDPDLDPALTYRRFQIRIQHARAHEIRIVLCFRFDWHNA